MNHSRKKLKMQNENDHFPVKISINNYLSTCTKDKTSKYQALMAMFLDMCTELSHIENSPKELVEDIRFLIDDYIKFNVNESIR